MLPPDTEVMCVTCCKKPASRRNRTSPRWYKVARNPPPDKASPIFFIADSETCAQPRNLARHDLRGHRRVRIARESASQKSKPTASAVRPPGQCLHGFETRRLA